MDVRVVYDETCHVDVGELTPDREALIVESLRALRELFEKTNGHPPGAFQVAQVPLPKFTWQDQNWSITYTVQERKRFGRAASVVVSFRRVALKSQ